MTVPLAATEVPRGFRPDFGVIRELSRNPLAAIGLLILVAICLIALLAPIWPMPDPDKTDLASRLFAVGSPGHTLGTDHLGRDMLARLIWGTRVSLAIGVIATLLAALSGSLIGLIAGFWGGRLDNLLMRLVDIVMALPYMLLALAIVAALGPGLVNAMLAIALVNVPFFARNVRGATLGLARRDFADAARLGGLGNWEILFTEILPNVMPSIVIMMSTTLGWMILETAGLSFLGLGAQPPTADLGSMLGEGRKLLITAPSVSVLPSLVIFLIVMSVNLLGDGIRDLLDPRLASGVPSRSTGRTRLALELAMPSKSTQPGPVDDGQTVAARGLSVDFSLRGKTFHAVGGVDFQVRRGECLGIVGESGCGKSVMALSLLGLVPSPPGEIIGGSVKLRGEEVLTAQLGRLQQLRGNIASYVFQDPLNSLHPMISVRDQLAEAIRLHQRVSRQAARTRAVELLQLVQIPNASERARAFPHELSGGMRQRVGIAMALANDPDIIIADEPTTALDVTIQAQVLSLLDQLRRERGLSLVLITHDFGVVSQMCDRVLVMYAGRAVESGAIEAVIRSPAHPYTRLLLACAPRLGERSEFRSTIPGRPPLTDRLPVGCAFAVRCPLANDECRSGSIPLVEVADSHLSRCLFAPRVFNGGAL